MGGFSLTRELQPRSLPCLMTAMLGMGLILNIYAPETVRLTKQTTPRACGYYRYSDGHG
jgi:hypothetical protein